MKALASTLILLTLLAGCSPESSSVEENTSLEVISHKKSAAIPANLSNPMDSAGKVYIRLLDAYYETSPDMDDLTLIIDRGESIAFSDDGFLNLPDVSAYNPISISDLEPYLDVQGSDIRNLLSSAYSTTGKNYLKTLTLQLTQLKALDLTYDQAYISIVALESIIAKDITIQQFEADALLTTTSVLRYALYHDKKRKRRDRDWDWMTGNIAATANAAIESQPQALLASFATDIYLD